MENDLPELDASDELAVKTRRPGRPPSKDAEGARPVRSVAWALQIMELLAQHDEGLAFADIATTLEIPSATAHRILATMEEAGYLHVDEDRTYALGSQFIRLAHRVLRIRTLFRDIARTFLRELVESTGETANLAILDGLEAAYLDQVQTNKMLRAQTFLRVPLHCSGTGKVLLAYQEPEAIEDILPHLSLDSRTDRTLTNPDELRAALAEIRDRGMAIDDEEMETGVRCIAAPVRVNGNIVASISIAGPTTRITSERVEELGSQVRDVAARLSEAAQERFPDLATGNLT